MQLLALLGVAAVAVAAGYGYTQTHFGSTGLEAMWVAAIICIATSAVAAVPVVMVAKWQPGYVGQAAFAGTAIRLMLTCGAAGAWQMFHAVHLRAFLGWLTVLYMLLLVVDTAFGVLLVRRHLPRGRESGS